MVEFLVANGADVDRGDNEGWTPLHATASCGFLSIARFLLDHGSNVAAVNNDGELAIDISESDEMDELLQKEIDRQARRITFEFGGLIRIVLDRTGLDRIVLDFANSLPGKVQMDNNPSQ